MNALAFFAQALVLAATGGMSWTLILPAALMAVILQCLWLLRRVLDPHFDMVLIMLGWGGLGMLMPGVVMGTPPCHTSVTAMWAGMLAASAWPAYRYARCLRAARAEGRLALTLAFDGLGMAAGMAMPWPAALPWLHHAAMLLGMTLGMGAAMLALQRVLRPQVPANS